jgi:hypothetical protein
VIELVKGGGPEQQPASLPLCWEGERGHDHLLEIARRGLSDNTIILRLEYFGGKYL